MSGAIDALALLARALDEAAGDDADLLQVAADIYDAADQRLAVLETTREPRLIGGPNE